MNSNSVVVGPLLTREGGYAFDTRTPRDGVSGGYVYRRIEDAYYARNVLIQSLAVDEAGQVVACNTVDEFDRTVTFMPQLPEMMPTAQRRLELKSDCLIEATTRLGSHRVG